MDAVEAVARALADLEIDNGEGGKYRLFELLDFSGENQTRVVIRTIAQAALSAARPFIAAEWQPIESAPKDGSEIVARDGKTGTAHVSWWDYGKWYDPDCHYYSEAPDFVPTEWTPLPAPPTAIKETIR